MKKPAFAFSLIALAAIFLNPSMAGADSARPQSPVSSLPRMGEAGALDLAAERRLGDRIAQQIYRDPDYLDDPVLGDYLQAIWQPLLAAARQRGDVPPELAERFAWELMISRDRTINAFALPGAYFGVHLGLLANVDTPDELASVLAHELTHVAQRHIARLIARQDQQTPWMVGAMILGALAANASKNTDVLQAAVVGGQAVAAQTQLNFSRDMEREADRIGYGVLTEAGFDGQGFAGMFDKLQHASRLNDDGSFPYLRSHPLTTERMADMKARSAWARDGAAVTVPVVSVQWHRLMAARARVLAETDVRRWQAWVQEATPAQVSDAGVLYAAALSASRLKQHNQGLALAQRLLAQPGLDEPARRAASLLALEIWLSPGAGGTPSTAQAASASIPGRAWLNGLPALAAQALAGADRASVLLGAQAAIRQGQPAQASQRLQVWVAEHAADALAWQALAQAWSTQGQPLRAVRAEAESRMAQLDVDGAVDRLRSARELGAAKGEAAAADHLELSIIDARYRQLAQRQREQMLEQKP